MNIVESNLQELYGVVCWNPNWDGNLNLRISFGQPSLHVREPIAYSVSVASRQRQVSIDGEWLLWILSGFWKLSIRDFGDVTITSSYKRRNIALARLQGQKLTSAAVNPNTSATQLEFDLGAKLAIRRVRVDSDGDIWSLYKPDGYVLSVRADGKFSDATGDTKVKRRKWKPIVMD